MSVQNPAGLRVRVVLFDAVGTLLQPQPSVAQAYAAAAAEQGVTLDAAQVGRRFHAAFAAEEARDAASGQATNEARERERWRRIVAAVLPEVPRPAQAFAALWDHFAQPGNWRVVAGARELLAELAARGLELAVASNFDARLLPLTAALAGLEAIERVFVSSQVGFRKPAAEFFARVAAAYACPPEELLLVGDDPRCDYLGARAAGWQALLVGGDESGIPRAEQIRALHEVALRIE